VDTTDSSAHAHTTTYLDTRAGDPFAYAGERPHGCYEGVVYLGQLVIGEDGEEEETVHPVLCRRCYG
jgi:hypothetical protein